MLNYVRAAAANSWISFAQVACLRISALLYFTVLAFVAILTLRSLWFQVALCRITSSGVYHSLEVVRGTWCYRAAPNCPWRTGWIWVECELSESPSPLASVNTQDVTGSDGNVWGRTVVLDSALSMRAAKIGEPKSATVQIYVPSFLAIVLEIGYVGAGVLLMRKSRASSKDSGPERGRRTDS